MRFRGTAAVLAASVVAGIVTLGLGAANGSKTTVL